MGHSVNNPPTWISNRSWRDVVDSAFAWETKSWSKFNKTLNDKLFIPSVSDNIILLNQMTHLTITFIVKQYRYISGVQWCFKSPSPHILSKSAYEWLKYKILEYILENKVYRRLLKDHVTMKTGVMRITEVNYIWKYIQIENSYFKL